MRPYSQFKLLEVWIGDCSDQEYGRFFLDERPEDDRYQ